jgi:hypothetical protein
MNFFYSRLFFLAILLIQGGQSQVLDGDIICSKFGTLATANAGRIQEYLNDNLGGGPIDNPPAGTYDTYTVLWDEPTFDGCEITIGADIIVSGTLPSQMGTATIKGRLDSDALTSGQVCITDLEVVELDIANLPPEIAGTIETFIAAELAVPQVCIPIAG